MRGVIRGLKTHTCESDRRAGGCFSLIAGDAQEARRQHEIIEAAEDLLFRVEPSVAGWLPHSPVLAQLRHTVLQARISLHRRSGPPSRVESGKTA